MDVNLEVQPADATNLPVTESVANVSVSSPKEMENAVMKSGPEVKNDPENVSIVVEEATGSERPCPMSNLENEGEVKQVESASEPEKVSESEPAKPALSHEQKSLSEEKSGDEQSEAASGPQENATEKPSTTDHGTRETAADQQDDSDSGQLPCTLDTDDRPAEVNGTGEDTEAEPQVLATSVMDPSNRDMLANPCECKNDGEESIPFSDSELSLKSESERSSERKSPKVEEEKVNEPSSPKKELAFPRGIGEADAAILMTEHEPVLMVSTVETGQEVVDQAKKLHSENEVTDTKKEQPDLHLVESFMIDETTIIDPTINADGRKVEVDKADLNFHNAFGSSSEVPSDAEASTAMDDNDDSTMAMDETTNDDTCGPDLDFSIVSVASSATQDQLATSNCTDVDIKDDAAVLPTPKKRGRRGRGAKPPVAKRKKPEVAPPSVQDEESRGSSVTTSSAKRFRSDIALLGENRSEPVTASNVAEYVWPPYDPRAESWVLQEQISEYLDIKSFKRRYPKLWRRPVEPVERDHLVEMGVVTIKQCDLGLTALRVSEVLDILFNEYPEKYEEYQKVQRERKESLRKKARAESLAPNADIRSVALRDTLSWNATFNKDRKDKRQCAFDLQTLQIHRKAKPIEFCETSEVPNLYPVALLPGQFQDYARYFSPAELRSLPLDSVVAPAPVDLQSDGDQSDSDESSSSDDSSSTTSSEDTQNDETASDLEPEDTYQKPGILCKICTEEKKLTKDGKSEPLIHCTKCDKSAHITCVGLTLDMYTSIRDCKGWMCSTCRVCWTCRQPFRLDANNEQRFANCGMCDRNYHLKCCGLKRRPEGRWHCTECAKCTSCGTTKPAEEGESGHWHHEHRRLADGTRVYFMTFCVRCLRLWKRGRVCPVCHKCLIPPIKNYEVVDCCSCQRKTHSACVKHLSDIEKRHYNCPKCILKGKRGPVFLPKFGFGFSK